MGEEHGNPDDDKSLISTSPVDSGVLARSKDVRRIMPHLNVFYAPVFSVISLLYRRLLGCATWRKHIRICLSHCCISYIVRPNIEDMAKLCSRAISRRSRFTTLTTAVKQIGWHFSPVNPFAFWGLADSLAIS